jgi:hypothetical protein
MSMTREEIENWATAYIEVEQLPSGEKHDSPLWWAVERFQIPERPQEAEDAWNAILEVLRRQPPVEVIGMLAAGPLEDLIDDWGPEFIDRIETEARTNPAFRHLLGGVWESSTPEVWLRIEAARGETW